MGQSFGWLWKLRPKLGPVISTLKCQAEIEKPCSCYATLDNYTVEILWSFPFCRFRFFVMRLHKVMRDSWNWNKKSRQGVAAVGTDSCSLTVPDKFLYHLTTSHGHPQTWPKPFLFPNIWGPQFSYRKIFWKIPTHRREITEKVNSLHVSQQFYALWTNRKAVGSIWTLFFKTNDPVCECAPMIRQRFSHDMASIADPPVNGNNAENISWMQETTQRCNILGWRWTLLCNIRRPFFKSSVSRIRPNKSWRSVSSIFSPIK